MILHPELLLGQIQERQRDLIAEAERERLFQAIRRRPGEKSKAREARTASSAARAKHA
jgi:hypothetical protein